MTATARALAARDGQALLDGWHKALVWHVGMAQKAYDARQARYGQITELGDDEQFLALKVDREYAQQQWLLDDHKAMAELYAAALTGARAARTIDPVVLIPPCQPTAGGTP